VFKMNHLHNRTYTRHFHNGKSSVVTWVQNRCQKCQRFLSKERTKFCERCSDKVTKRRYELSSRGKEVRRIGQRVRRLNSEIRSLDILRSKIYRHADELQVGDIV
jgi:predicted amidophosphoribosyltransferase